MKALWKAHNGQEFIIEGKDITEVKNKIEDLRKKLNIATPDFISMASQDPEINKQIKDHATLDINNLPENEQQAIRQAEREAMYRSSKKLD